MLYIFTNNTHFRIYPYYKCKRLLNLTFTIIKNILSELTYSNYFNTLVHQPRQCGSTYLRIRLTEKLTILFDVKDFF